MSRTAVCFITCCATLQNHKSNTQPRAETRPLGRVSCFVITYNPEQKPSFGVYFFLIVMAYTTKTDKAENGGF